MQGPRRSSADDGDGTVGVVDLVERSDQHRVYFGQGVHHSAVFPDIHATAVIIMDLVEHVPSGEKTSTSTRFDVCVRMNNFLISGLVKSLRPFLKKTIIGKFSKAFFVADQVGRLIAKDPKSVSQDAADFPRLSSEDRSQFLSLISKLPQ
jgi:hypothetical protein